MPNRPTGAPLWEQLLTGLGPALLLGGLLVWFWRGWMASRQALLWMDAVGLSAYAVVGSMNITWYGVNLREEYLELRTEEDFVARARLDAMDRFGIPS